MALVAPRGLTDLFRVCRVRNPLGFEQQAYRSALGCALPGREQNIWLSLRREHETTAGDVENFIDFFDAVFERRAHAQIETWVHGYPLTNGGSSRVRASTLPRIQ